MSDQHLEVNNAAKSTFPNNAAPPQDGHIQAEAHVQRGQALFEEQRWEEARAEFEAARAGNEQDSEVHNWLGRVGLLQWN
jgi:Flp pilus assembly protein TadD